MITYQEFTERYKSKHNYLDRIYISDAIKLLFELIDETKEDNISYAETWSNSTDGSYGMAKHTAACDNEELDVFKDDYLALLEKHDYLRYLDGLHKSEQKDSDNA